MKEYVPEREPARTWSLLRKVSQLQDNLASFDLALSAEHLNSLDEASRIELGFPQSIYEREMVRSIRYGGTWDRLLL
jgi:hypothetical protein